MGKPITMVNKMPESVLTQEPRNASSLTQAPYRSLLQDKFATSCKSKVWAGFGKSQITVGLVKSFFVARIAPETVRRDGKRL